MTLFGLIVLLVVVGVGLYLINRYVPMQQQVKTILNVIVVVVVCLWVAQELGLIGALNKPIKLR